MPILASCPYCGKGKVRAPKDAIGLTATCPNCRNCFTIVESEQLAKAPAGPLPPAAQAATEGAAAMQTATAPLVGSMAMSAPPVMQFSMPDYSEAPAASKIVLGLALVAITICGIGLAVSQVPYGRIVTAFFSVIGLFLALASLILADRKPLVPGLATAFNSLALVLVIFLPSWLGLTTWKPVTPTVDPNKVQAVGHDASLPMQAEWVDVSTADWQLEDVRVGVVTVALAPVEVTGPKEKKKWTDRVLHVTLRIRNSGVARKIDFMGWDLNPPPETPVVKLTDASGLIVKAKQFDPEWLPSVRRPNAALFPGKTAEQLLLFDAPKDSSGPLKLELPEAPFAGTQPVRVLIPWKMISQRNTP